MAGLHLPLQPADEMSSSNPGIHLVEWQVGQLRSAVNVRIL